MSSALPKSIRASLIVLNFNGREVIESCINSLVEAKGPKDEIIVVDNASTDGSVESLEKRRDIRLLRLDENTFIFGLNRGLEVARGQFVAFLNNDILVEPEFVERCLERFSDGMDVFAVCPRVLGMNGDDQGTRTSGFWLHGLIFFRPLSHSSEPTDCFFAVGGQSFFRRGMLDEIGSIDPLFRPMYHEDVELSYRAWKRDWRIRYEPLAIAHHVGGHSSQRVFTPSQLRSFVRQNEFLTVWKNITDASLLAEHVALIPFRLVAALLRRDWPTIVGFAHAARRLGEVRVARRTARTHMRVSDNEVLRRLSEIR
jgi:GT2 family glycosyltransferase